MPSLYTQQNSATLSDLGTLCHKHFTIFLLIAPQFLDLKPYVGQGEPKTAKTIKTSDTVTAPSPLRSKSHPKKHPN